MLKTCFSAVGLMLLVAALGCGGGRGTADVAGTVKYKGQPVAGATVTFLPKSSDAKAKSATGRTDGSGQYTLSTYFSPDEQPSGAIPGDYVVTVTKIDEPEGIVDPYKGQVPKNQLPDKYSNPQRSPLSAAVKSGAANRFDFSLED